MDGDTPPTPFAGGARVDESKATAVVYVDAGSASAHPDGSTLSTAFRSIQEGLNAAFVNRAHVGTKVLISSGVYREFLSHDGDSDSGEHPIVLQAATGATVVVTGADVVSNWATVDSPNRIYATPWTNKWGSRLPDGSSPNANPVGGRREMVFVDGIRLAQVNAFDRLVDNSIFVDESKGFIYAKVAASSSFTAAIKEVSVRERVARFDNTSQIAVRGLQFRAAASDNGSGQAAAYFVNSDDILIDSCSFSGNNWFGLSIGGGAAHGNYTISHSTLDDNGGAGLDGTLIKDSLFDRNTTNGNNWRGLLAGSTFWSTSGMKLWKAHRVLISNHTANDNYAVGLWLDTDMIDVQVTGSKFENNLEAGIDLEANPGPIVISGATLGGNHRTGLYVSASDNVTLDRSQIEGNWRSQIHIDDFGGSGRGTDAFSLDGRNFETDGKFAAHVDNHLLTNNTIRADTSGQPLFEISLADPDPGVYGYASEWARWLAKLNPGTNNNAYGHPALTEVFFDASRTPAGFPAWKLSTGNDQSSTFVTAYPEPNALSLRGGRSVVAATVDLTAEGTLDWVRWSGIDIGKVDRKLGATLLADFSTTLDANQGMVVAEGPTKFSWSDGSPVATMSGSSNGLGNDNFVRAISFSAPADTSPRTLRVYVSAQNTRLAIDAELSDASSAPYVDQSFFASGGSTSAVVYRISCASASPNQRLIVTLSNAARGTVGLYAATLAAGSQ